MTKIKLDQLEGFNWNTIKKNFIHNAQDPKDSLILHPFKVSKNKSVSSTIDKMTLRKIKKGLIEIEDQIDLHYFTLQEAYKVLECFLSQSLRNTKKLILVITGKGDRAQDQRKTIKYNFSRWVENHWQDYILSYNQAHTKHGGLGAYYVFLRRR